jgi:hypothetical protein
MVSRRRGCADIGVTLFAKVQSINDRHGKASLNDFAVGLDLMVAAVTLVLAKFADLGQKRSSQCGTPNRYQSVCGAFSISDFHRLGHLRNYSCLGLER